LGKTEAWDKSSSGSCPLIDILTHLIPTLGHDSCFPAVQRIRGRVMGIIICQKRVGTERERKRRVVNGWGGMRGSRKMSDPL
jgi:hypothetical protein